MPENCLQIVMVLTVLASYGLCLEYFEIQILRGYFCVTSGELTKDMIQEYLEHHFEKDPNDKFDIE